MPLEVICELVKKPGEDPGSDYWFFWNINCFKNSGMTRYLYSAIHIVSAAFESTFGMLLDVAKHFEEGAKKYGENNWQKGLPAQCYIDSAMRHYIKWKDGCTDEPHLRAVIWNLMCCIWEVDFSPRAKMKENATTIALYADSTLIEHIPSDLVRYGDCSAGLFEFGDEGVFVKTEIADADKYGAYIAIHVNTGHTRLFDNDILVRPIDSLFTDERCGDE